jgi:hypothetical protein
MNLRATRAERRALSRLPLGEASVHADTYRRALWWRLTQKGWAEWKIGKVLVCTSAGYVASARSQQEYEDRMSEAIEEAETDDTGWEPAASGTDACPCGNQPTWQKDNQLRCNVCVPRAI